MSGLATLPTDALLLLLGFVSASAPYARWRLAVCKRLRAALAHRREGHEEQPPLPLRELLGDCVAGAAFTRESLRTLEPHRASVCLLCVRAGPSALAWARCAGFLPDSRAVDCAAEARDEAALRLLCLWQWERCWDALRQGRADALEWAEDMGFPWNADLELHLHFSHRN